MIPVVDKTTITDFMDGEKTIMTVRPEDWKKLSGLLINLYSDTIMAVVREYSTNARDTHLEMDVTEPILITTPNYFNNTFIVQDRGSGMSKHTLQETYAMFGASTKDDSNDYNGSMGLGSKSALTYTDSFTIISIKDGIKTTAMIGQDEEGNGIMEILGDHSTDEPNGTTIEIPCKSGDEYKFKTKAAEIFKWWPDGSVLVDGHEPEKVDLEQQGYTQLDSGSWFKKELYQSTITFIMGGVAYEHKFDRVTKLVSNVSIVKYIDNGTVQFNPNRESLLMNRITTKRVEAMIEETVNEIVELVTTKASAANDILEALSIWEEFDGLVAGNFSKWNGIPLASRVGYDGRLLNVNLDVTEKVRNYLYAKATLKAGDVAFITNYNGIGMTKQQRQGIFDFAQDNDDYAGIKRFFFGAPVPMMFSHLPTVDWSEIKPYVKTVKGTAASQRFDMYYFDSADKEVERDVQAVPDKKTILYTSPSDIRGGWNNGWYSMNWIKEVPNIVVVVINANRHAKFARDYGAKPLHKYINDWVDKKVNKLTHDEMIASRLNVRAYDIFYGKTNDPAIDKVGNDRVSYGKKVSSASRVASDLHMVSVQRRIEIKMMAENIKMPRKHFEKYPLISDGNFYNPSATYMEHAIDYINAIYKKETE